MSSNGLIGNTGSHIVVAQIVHEAIRAFQQATSGTIDPHWELLSEETIAKKVAVVDRIAESNYENYEHEDVMTWLITRGILLAVSPFVTTTS